MKRIQKIEISIMVLFLVIGLIGPVFGMNIFLMPVVILLGLGLAGLTAIVADKV